LRLVKLDSFKYLNQNEKKIKIIIMGRFGINFGIFFPGALEVSRIAGGIPKFGISIKI